MGWRGEKKHKKTLRGWENTDLLLVAVFCFERGSSVNRKILLFPAGRKRFLFHRFRCPIPGNFPIPFENRCQSRYRRLKVKLFAGRKICSRHLWAGNFLQDFLHIRTLHGAAITHPKSLCPPITRILHDESCRSISSLCVPPFPECVEGPHSLSLTHTLFFFFCRREPSRKKWREENENCIQTKLHLLRSVNYIVVSAVQCKIVH